VIMTVRPDMVNGHGIVHGGFLATLADSAFAVACNTYGQVTVAAGFDIVFVASTRLGEELTAEAVERARYGRSGLYDVSVRATDPAGDVRPVAEFRGRSRSLGRPFPSMKDAPEETT
jgi:acyl-CoA thioesterase